MTLGKGNVKLHISNGRGVKTGNISATDVDGEPGSASDFNGKRKDVQVVGFRRMTTPSSVASKTLGLKLVTSFLRTMD